ATIALTAPAPAATDTSSRGNLPDTQLVVHVSGGPDAFIPHLASAQVQAARARVGDIATSLHAQHVVALAAAINPAEPEHPGPGGDQVGRDATALLKVTPLPRGFQEQLIAPLYVATSDLLERYGIDVTRIDPMA